MHRIIVTLLIVSISVTLSAQKIKIACVGNSITYGARIANRDQNSYPAQLEYALGDGYQVRNFGVSGRTLLSTADKPYIKEAAYRESLAFLPDIVIIKLGTNDSKSSNVDKLGGFKSDYQALIDSYRALSSKPRIILCLPVYCYLTEGVFEHANTIYREVINPIIEELSYENNIEIVDLFHLFSDSYRGYLMPDKLHPSSIGAGMIAQRLSSVICRPFSTDFKLQISQKHPFNFHGYCGYTLDKVNKVVVPRYAAKGNPWVWRFHTWDQDYQADIALLEQGFHIVYSQISDINERDEAMSSYDNLYNQMVARQMSRKVVLECVGPEGWQGYKWAIQNSDKVAALYAITPLKEDSVESEQKLKELQTALGIDRVWSSAQMPFAVDPIIRMVLRQTGLYQNPAIKPIPGNEYRVAAGWKEPNEWHTISQEIADSLAVRKVDVLLLGNSITMGFVGSRRLISGRGKRAFDQYFDSWECAGISGDQTQHLLWRLQNHHYERSQPKVVVITIGVNNLASGDSVEETVEGMLAIVAEAQRRFVGSRIIFFGLLPPFRNPDHDLRVKHDKVHQLLAQTAFDPCVDYVDARTTFLHEDGTQKQELYSSDQLHLSTLGYEAWAALIHRLIRQ